MKDSILLMDIYKRYLETTADLITILQRNYEKAEKNGHNEELKKKYQEFQQHAQKLIEKFNTDLHILLRIDWELKDLEDKGN